MPVRIYAGSSPQTFLTRGVGSLAMQPLSPAGFLRRGFFRPKAAGTVMGGGTPSGPHRT